MPRQFRLLNDAALRVISTAAKELPATERPAFLRVCAERFVSNTISARVIDTYASMTTKQIDAGNFYSNVNRKKNFLSRGG
jgi:hypothetical protein